LKRIFHEACDLKFSFHIGAVADDKRNPIVGESRGDKNAEEQRGEKGKLHVSMHKPLPKDTAIILQSAVFGKCEKHHRCDIASRRFMADSVAKLILDH
jgi:hypothetical protein